MRWVRRERFPRVDAGASRPSTALGEHLQRLQADYRLVVVVGGPFLTARQFSSRTHSEPLQRRGPSPVVISWWLQGRGSSGSGRCFRN